MCWDLTTATSPSHRRLLPHSIGARPTVNGPPWCRSPDSEPRRRRVAQPSCPRWRPRSSTPAELLRQRAHRRFPNGAIRGQLSEGPPPAGEAHLLPSRCAPTTHATTPGRSWPPTRPARSAWRTAQTARRNSIIAVPPGATAAIVTLTVTRPWPWRLRQALQRGTGQPAGHEQHQLGRRQSEPGRRYAGGRRWTSSVKITGGADSTHVVIDVIGYLF